MRHGIRIQPYVSPDLFRQLRAYAAARDLTVSAVIGAALGEYLERDEVEDALIVRRLDGVTHAVGQLQRDVETLAVGFGRFVRFAFFSAPAAADGSVVRRAETLYGAFLDQVREQLREGVRFTRQVFPPQRSSAAAPGIGTGGREKERRS